MRGSLALFVLFSYTLAWPLFVKESLLTAVPIQRVAQSNLETDARVELTHNLPLQICFQAVYPLPLNPDTWNVTCSEYLSFDADGTRIIHTGSVRLRNVEYRVGIYSINGFQTQSDIILKVGNLNDSCLPNEVFDETDDLCRAPDGHLISDSPANGVFPPGKTLYYSFTIGPLAGSASVKGLGTQPGNLIFQIRYAGSPSYGVHDGSSGSTAIVNYPKPGTYYVAVTSSEMQETTGSFILHVEDCSTSNQTAGPGCRKPYTIAVAPSYTGVAISGIYTYWRVAATEKSPLYVSVRASDGKSNPILLAAQGQLPRLAAANGDVENVDFNRCTEPFCNAANIIRHNAAPGVVETWYVAVIPQEGMNGTEYTLWFDTPCAPPCTEHGTCTTEGPNTGLCVCQDNWAGVNCSTSFAVTPENIVLYIIAGLVVLSGVAAFIAAMVTKKPKKPRENS